MGSGACDEYSSVAETDISNADYAKFGRQEVKSKTDDQLQAQVLGDSHRGYRKR